MNNTNLLKTVLFSIIICLVAPMISNASNSNILSFTLPSGLPNYNEIYMQGIGSTLYINTEITGKVVVAREIKADKSLGKKYYFNFIQISDNWAEMVFDNPILNFNEIILLGTKGNILLKKSVPGYDILVYKNGTSSGTLVSRLGFVNGTIYFPDSELLDIDSIDVGIQKSDGEKIKGTVLVATNRTIAFQFKGVNSNFVNNGKSSLVIRLRSKSIFLNLDSWGYTFDVERVDPNKINLVSNVFGLEPGRQLNVKYEVYEGQVIEPYSTIFTVEEINKGKPIAVVQDGNKPIKFDLLLAK
ncbi:MAG: hypothetical protein V3U21_00300 [Thermodesulfobacteriota bacterium]